MSFAKDDREPAAKRPFVRHRLFVPRSRTTAAPMVVALHGCTQTADDFAIGTGFDAVGERAGAFVLYPQQSRRANPRRCWNWFLPEHQTRHGGEPAEILALVEEVASRHLIDRERVFVTGLSAGGAMAAILAEQAPDVFAAVGIAAGVPLHAARDVKSAFEAMSGRSVPALGGGPGTAAYGRLRATIWTGSDDDVVAPRNATALAMQFTAMLGLDGRAPVPAVDGGAAVLRWCDDRALVRVESWTIPGMGHAWSGGNARGSFTDPSGPSASNEMMTFFLR